MALDDDQLHQLILACYDAALDPMRWPCVRERLRDALGAEGYRSIVGEVADGDARSAFASHATSLAPPVAHRDDRKADASDTGLLERLLPHLDRCRQIQVRLTTGAIRIGGLVAALDRLPLAILLLDRGARVVHVNRCAEQLLRAGDGLAIRDGRVTATSRPETERLQRLIAAACTRRIPGPGSMMALPRPTLGGELCVLVARSRPAPSPEIVGQPRFCCSRATAPARRQSPAPT